MKREAQKHLESYGIKASPQRLAVMEYLMAHRVHPSADEIFSALVPSMPTLSKTTVYNTLNALAQLGAIQALDIDPRQLHFDCDTTPHAHFLCLSCGRIEDVWLDAAEFRGLTDRKAPQGAVVRSVQLIYKGTCKTCNQKQTDN